MNAEHRHVAVVGGGRWARVIAGVLIDILPVSTQLSLCSPGYPLGWDSWLRSRPEEDGRRCNIASDLVGLLRDESLQRVFIARAAQDHCETAVLALRYGKSVFVEKPFALDGIEAAKVLAAAKGSTCVTGLVYLFANNIQRFAEAARTVGAYETIHISWCDAASEHRYGEAKNYDAGLNCVLDAFPHVWSLVRSLDEDAPLTALDGRAFDGGRKVDLSLTLGSARVEVGIERDADARRREIVVTGKTGKASIDFSVEPGHAHLNGVDIDVATGFSSPLARELGSFLADASGPGDTALVRCDRAIESIILADELLKPIRRDQLDQIVRGLRGDAGPTERRAGDYALREIVLERIGRRGDAEIWQTVRQWLTGETPDCDVPACIRVGTALPALRKRLSSLQDVGGTGLSH